MTIRNSNFTWITGAIALAGIVVILALGGLSAGQQQQQTTTLHPENKMSTETSGFYCNLKAFTPVEREYHRLLSQKLAEARMETKELADGYAFRLQPESVSLAELADWITNERKCCPFFDFAIELERNGGPLWLKLQGSEGVKQFIRSEFRIQNSGIIQGEPS